MAWTTPKTWASGYVVLAADLNTHLRDNLNVTAPAVMTTAGDIIYASGANTPARLAKSTTSTQYLANTGTSNVPAWNEVALATGVSGVLPVANGGVGVALSAPGADRILFWDHSATAYTYLTAGTNLTISGTTMTADAPTQAVQSDIKAETDEDTYLPPNLVRHSPGVAKVYCRISAAGALGSGDYNVASITDSGAGDRTIVFDADFADLLYAWADGLAENADAFIAKYSNIAAGSIRQVTQNKTQTANEDHAASFMAFGDQ